MRRWRAAGLLAAGWLVAASAAAEPAGEAEASDALDFGEPAVAAAPDPSEASAASDALGFGDPAASAVAPTDEPPPSEAEPPATSYGGTVRLDGALWTERLRETPLAKARTSLDLWLRHRLPNGRIALGVHGAYDLAYRVDRASYDQATLDTYERLVRPGESFIALERPRGSLSVGTQIVVFGHADVLSVVDVVNPHDLREAVLTDPMDLRVPVLMTRAAVTGDRTRFEVVVVHEAYFDLVPPPFGTWSPVRRPILEDPRVAATPLPALLPSREVRWDHAEPRLGLESQQVFGRLTTSAGPVDLGFYGAVYRDPIGTVTLPSTSELLENEVLRIRLDHLRVQTLAASTSFVVGSVVGWAELAVDVRRAVNVEAEVDFVGTERRTLFRWNVGARYQGPRNGVVALEYAQGTERGPGASDAALLVPVLPTTLIARVDRAFARDALRVHLAAAVTGERLAGGALGLGELAYAPRDGLTLSVGYAAFAPLRREASLIWGYTRHDRAFVRLRYDFAR